MEVIRAAGTIRAVGLAVLLLIALGAGSAQALTLDPVGEFDQPVYVTSDPSDAQRLFVAEREGGIELVENGVASEFADLSAEVGCGGDCVGERGLMSIALSPDFASSGRLFVFYAQDVTGTLHVEELVSTDPGHDTADIGTLRPLLEIPHADAANHNGGQLQFDGNGLLYVSTGDGGGSDGEFEHAQDPSSPLGKILRVNPNGPAGAYEVWSSGLRNPYRFSFDRLTGDLTIGEVGQSAREEIDFVPSPAPGVVGGQGHNFGWNCLEGFLPGPATEPQCSAFPPPLFTSPVFDYAHTPDPELGGSGRCSVIGGYVVRDPGLGALRGHYLYTDLCSGGLRALQLPKALPGVASGDCSLRLRVDNPLSFGEDALGQLYVVEAGGGVYRIEGSPPPRCPVISTPPPPPPVVKPPQKPSVVGITAQRRRVERGKAAVLTVWVSPCNERRGEVVALFRNGSRNGSKFVSRACTARFLRRVHRTTTFAAFAYPSDAYVGATSRPLKIKIKPRKRTRQR